MRLVCRLVLKISRKLYAFFPLSEMMMHLYWARRMSNAPIVMPYFPHRMAKPYPRVECLTMSAEMNYNNIIYQDIALEQPWQFI